MQARHLRKTTIALAILSLGAVAQEKDPGFTASADATLAYEDNLFRVTDSLAVSDTYLVVNPELEFIGAVGKHRFEASYKGSYGKFADINDADFTDHALKARIDFDHSLKFSTRLEAGYSKEHEEAGTLDRVQLGITEYNKYDHSFAAAHLTYGTDASTGKITFAYRRNERDYLNNNLDFLDNTNDQFSARFTYRIAPRTNLYVEGLYNVFDYTPPAGFFEIDNTYKRYRAGVTWNFTNKLKGDVNIGYQDRDYDIDFLRDISGLAYNAEVTWSVNTYTTIAFVADRESVDSSLEEAGGFLRTTFGTSIEHDFSEYITLNAEVTYSKDELVFSSSREDKRYSALIGLDYDLNRLISVGGKITYDERESTLANAVYDATAIMFNVKVLLEH